MVLAKALAGAVLGGAIGAAIWAGISYGTGYEIGWIAWGVGLLVGGGTLLFAREGADMKTGIVAAAVSIAALAAGRYASTTLTVNDMFHKEMPGAIHLEDEAMIVRRADAVAEEWESAGKSVKWPEGMTIDEADEEADYPKDVWKEASARWGKLTPDEQQAEKAKAEQELKEGMEMLRGAIVEEGFLGSFDGMDAVFCALALLTAFKVGSGASGND